MNNNKQIELGHANLKYDMIWSITLDRTALQNDKINLPIEDITIYDFKSSVVSLDQLDRAEKIIFINGEQSRVLKNRF